MTAASVTPIADDPYAVGEAGGRVIRGGSLRVAGAMTGVLAGSPERAARRAPPRRHRLRPLPDRRERHLRHHGSQRGGHGERRRASVQRRRGQPERRALIANLTGTAPGARRPRRARGGRLRPDRRLRRNDRRSGSALGAAAYMLLGGPGLLLGRPLGHAAPARAGVDRRVPLAGHDGCCWWGS